MAMTDLPPGYLQAFPVQYHRHQIASGVIGGGPSRRRHAGEINFGQSFGADRNHGQDAHNAIDIMGARGLRIVAACAGTVAHSWRTRNGKHPGVGTSAGGGNFVVIIDSRQGYYHYYAHMETPSTVRSGQSVAAGTLLGYLGDTGRARGTPPHLHYQVSIRDGRGALQSFLNPYPELARLAARWQSQVSAWGRVVIPVSHGGPPG
jgi:murein DD-endopeptidase MepM/ murein hydrolase activator NlpD